MADMTGDLEIRIEEVLVCGDILVSIASLDNYSQVHRISVRVLQQALEVVDPHGIARRSGGSPE